MAVLRNGSKCSHTTCMLRFFTVSRLALNTNLIFEIDSHYSLFCCWQVVSEQKVLFWKSVVFVIRAFERGVGDTI